MKRRLGGSDLVQTNPRIGQFLQIIDEEVAHTSHIVTDLTGFARVSPPSLLPVRLEDVVEGTLSNIEMRDNISVVRSFDPEFTAIMADGVQLQQRVFMNLVTNARDAMPCGGELTITTRTTDEFAEVIFTDTGTGIDQETMAKIFEPLFTTKSDGTGLGLAVCQQILSNHGGSVDVISVPGQGSTFTVRLPLHPDMP